jgi:hypothetical protein
MGHLYRQIQRNGTGIEKAGPYRRFIAESRILGTNDIA